MARVKKHFFSKSPEQKPLYLQDIIKPLYILTSLLGLFPYTVTFVKDKSCFVIIRKSIYVNSVCGVTLCLLIVAFSSLHIQEVFLVTEYISMTKAILTQVNYALELVALIVFCFVAYVCAFLNRIKYVRILNQIIQTWNGVPLNVKSKKILTNLRFQVNVICMGGMLVLLIIEIIINFARNDSLWKMILVMFTFLLPQMLQFITLALYYILVMMLVALLQNITLHCDQLLIENVNATEGFMQFHNKTTLALSQMKLVYKKVFEIKTNINEAFQGLILMTALQCFHSIVSEAHIIYHGLVIQNTITLHEVVNCGFWALCQFLKIYSISYSGNMLKVQALNIGQTLHKIPIEKQNARWLTEVQHFSTMMYFQNIELTVYGYFPLDATLIYNTVTSATMYLIILVQFDK